MRVEWNKAEFKGMVGRAVYMRAHAWAYTWSRFADRRNIPCLVGGYLRTWAWFAAKVFEQADNWPNAGAVLYLVEEITTGVRVPIGKIGEWVDLGHVLNLMDELDEAAWRVAWLYVLAKHKLDEDVARFKATIAKMDNYDDEEFSLGAAEEAFSL